MERLLSSEMNRRVMLLNYLYGATDWLTSERLARSLDCSSKTLFLDCQYLEERWGEHLTIEVSKKSGIKMITAPHESIHDIYTDIIKEAPAFTLLESVFFHPNHESDYFEEKLFMSKSTLYRLLKKINVSLRDRELKLSQKTFFLSGKTERQIRYFFSAYFLEVYGIHYWPFSLDKGKILAFVKVINQQFQLQLTDIQIIHMVFSIAVTVIREQQGFFVQVEKTDQEELLKEQQQMLCYQLEVYSFMELLSNDLPEYWYEDFIYTVFWWNFGWRSTSEKQGLAETGQFFVEEIQQALQIPINEKSEQKIVRLFQNIYALHNMYPFKKYMIYDRFSYSSKSIRQNYVVFTAVVSKALAAEEKRKEFPWSTLYKDEILHEVMVYWEGLPLHIDHLRKVVSVQVLSDLGQEHAKSLVDQLEIAFQNKISISCQEHVLFESEQTEKVSADLYVANYSPKNIKKEQLIVVEDILSSKDLDDLRDFVDRARLILPKDIPYLQS